MWPARFPAGGGDELWLVAIVFEDDRRRIAVERSRLSAAEQRFADPEDDDCSHHRAGEGPTVVLGERERQFPLLYGVSATGARSVWRRPKSPRRQSRSSRTRMRSGPVVD